MEKEMQKGFKKVHATERTVFNDEEQRRYTFVNTAFTYLILNLFGNLYLFKLVHLLLFDLFSLSSNNVDYLLVCS